MAVCKWCGKEFDDDKIGGHTTFCKMNPNFEENIKLSRSNIKKMVLARQEQRESNPNEHTRKEFTMTCEKCGKEFVQITSEYCIANGNISRFCSRKCANSHPKACEDKTKIVKCIDCGKEVEVKIQSDPKKIRCDECKLAYNNSKGIKKPNITDTYVERKCVICGNVIPPIRTKSGKYSKTKYCSKECHQIDKVKNGHKAYESSKMKGLHKPWRSRNITSYPENFWIRVLENNNIKFAREYFLNKKYFLDFYIEVNGRKIDLEIDGKQHKREDHIKHDKIRDEYVSSLGIEVYRVPWNSINTESGKILMKEKIDNFLLFYNK